MLSVMWSFWRAEHAIKEPAHFHRFLWRVMVFSQGMFSLNINVSVGDSLLGRKKKKSQWFGCLFSFRWGGFADWTQRSHGHVKPRGSLADHHSRRAGGSHRLPRPSAVWRALLQQQVQQVVRPPRRLLWPLSLRGFGGPGLPGRLDGPRLQDR